MYCARDPRALGARERRRGRVVVGRILPPATLFLQQRDVYVELRPATGYMIVHLVWLLASAAPALAETSAAGMLAAGYSEMDADLHVEVTPEEVA